MRPQFAKHTVAKLPRDKVGDKKGSFPLRAATMPGATRPVPLKGCTMSGGHVVTNWGFAGFYLHRSRVTRA